MINQVMKETWHQSAEFAKLADWQQRALLVFIQNTGLGVYKQWVAAGKQAPLEEVMQLAESLMSGVDEFLKLAK